MPQKERDAIMQQLGSQFLIASVNSGDLPAFSHKTSVMFHSAKNIRTKLPFLAKRTFLGFRGFPCVVFGSLKKCTFLNELRMASVKAIEALCDHFASFFFLESTNDHSFFGESHHVFFFFWDLTDLDLLAAEVSQWQQSCIDLHRFVGSWFGCATGWELGVG